MNMIGSKTIQIEGCMHFFLIFHFFYSFENFSLSANIWGILSGETPIVCVGIRSHKRFFHFTYDIHIKRTKSHRIKIHRYSTTTKLTFHPRNQQLTGSNFELRQFLLNSKNPKRGFDKWTINIFWRIVASDRYMLVWT